MFRVSTYVACLFLTVLFSIFVSYAQLQNPYDVTASVTVIPPAQHTDQTVAWNPFAPGPNGCKVSAFLLAHCPVTGTGDFEILRGEIFTISGQVATITWDEHNLRGYTPVDTTKYADFSNVDLRHYNPEGPRLFVGVFGMTPNTPAFFNRGRYEIHATGSFPDPVQH